MSFGIPANIFNASFGVILEPTYPWVGFKGGSARLRDAVNVLGVFFFSCACDAFGAPPPPLLIHPKPYLEVHGT